MNENDPVVIKARLLARGTVSMDAPVKSGNATSTAGPSAGLQSIFFRFGEHRVRLLVDDDSPVRLVLDGDNAVITENETELVRGQIEPIAAHCPGQVYVNIFESCIYHCAYCSVPFQQPRLKTVEEVVELVENFRVGVDAISITSGVARSPEDDLPHILEIVKAVRVYGLPIGVSVYPCNDCSSQLFDAGAHEVKYNLEVASKEIFDELCPDLDRRYIKTSLLDAVNVFGRNRVYSNIIIGLGETDDEVYNEIGKLAGMGVIPVLRPYNPHPRLAGLDAERPSAERLLALAKHLNVTLEMNGLDFKNSLTMCGKCTGCDLAPGVDF